MWRQFWDVPKCAREWGQRETKAACQGLSFALLEPGPFRLFQLILWFNYHGHFLTLLYSKEILAWQLSGIIPLSATKRWLNCNDCTFSSLPFARTSPEKKKKSVLKQLCLFFQILFQVGCNTEIRWNRSPDTWESPFIIQCTVCHCGLFWSLLHHLISSWLRC